MIIYNLYISSFIQIRNKDIKMWSVAKKFNMVKSVPAQFDMLTPLSYNQKVQIPYYPVLN